MTRYKGILFGFLVLTAYYYYTRYTPTNMASNLNMKSVLVTGANRGIGLEFVKQLVALPKPPANIIATCRNVDKATDLKELASKHQSVKIQQYDTTDYGNLPTLVKFVEKTVGADGLNCLINNAGIKQQPDAISTVTRDVMMKEIETNAVAPLMLTQALLPLLKKASGKVSGSDMSVSRASVINISTGLGSLTANTDGGMYPYRTSKAALNMVTRSLAADLKGDNIMVVSLHPGWVKTDMGGKDAMFDTQTAVKGLLNALGGLSGKDTGEFFSNNGEKVPW